MTAAREFRAAADAGGALFVLNDRPDLVAACGADGVHVGQDDGSPAEARAAVGRGRDRRALDARARTSATPRTPTPTSTTSPSGPVHATPTKPGRPAAGLDYVSYAAAHADKPWFAIGGLDAGNVAEVIARGATRVVVVRAITESDDPESAARGAAGRAGGPPWASAAVRPGPAPAPRAGAGRRGYERSAAAQRRRRAPQLEPLAPGERPRAVTVAAVDRGA